MKHLNVTFDTAEQNLAIDEALLLAMEEAPDNPETLRVWEPQTRHVVLGRASKVADEVQLAACREDNIAIYRRSTGGATILTGPGCLFFSVVLSRRQRPELQRIDRIHDFVLGQQAGGLSALVPGVVRAGTSDLVIDQRPDKPPLKFSGNSLRIRRDAILYHGTLLYDFPLADIAKYLGTPPRQPDYRAGRSHGKFVANLPETAERIITAIVEAWGADEMVTNWPQQQVADLVTNKYTCDEWNLRL